MCVSIVGIYHSLLFADLICRPREYRKRWVVAALCCVIVQDNELVSSDSRNISICMSKYRYNTVYKNGSVDSAKVCIFSWSECLLQQIIKNSLWHTAICHLKSQLALNILPLFHFMCYLFFLHLSPSLCFFCHFFDMVCPINISA